MSENEKPDNPGRRKWIKRAVTGTGATLLASTGVTAYEVGRVTELSDMQSRLPEQIAPDFTSRNFPQAKADVKTINRYGEPAAEGSAVLAGAYTVAKLAQKWDEFKNPEPQPPMYSQTRREFMKSATERVANTALLGTTAVALYNVGELQQAQSMREHIPATTPPVQKTKIEEILDRDAQANKALIGNSALLGGAAAALSYAEREARSKDSYLASPTERS